MQITIKLTNPEAFLLKVNVIKAVRALSGLGLKEAKEGVDEVHAGKTFTFESNGDAEHLNTIKENGIIFIGERATPPTPYVRDARNLAIRAIKNSDYSVAQDVLDLLKKLDPNGV